VTKIIVPTKILVTVSYDNYGDILDFVLHLFQGEERGEGKIPVNKYQLVFRIDYGLYRRFF